MQSENVPGYIGDQDIDKILKNLGKDTCKSGKGKISKVKKAYVTVRDENVKKNEK